MPEFDQECCSTSKNLVNDNNLIAFTWKKFIYEGHQKHFRDENDISNLEKAITRNANAKKIEVITIKKTQMLNVSFYDLFDPFKLLLSAYAR